MLGRLLGAVDDGAEFMRHPCHLRPFESAHVQGRDFGLGPGDGGGDDVELGLEFVCASAICCR